MQKRPPLSRRPFGAQQKMGVLFRGDFYKEARLGESLGKFESHQGEIHVAELGANKLCQHAWGGLIDRGNISGKKRSSR